MSLPKQVQKQSEDVQALYKELNNETVESNAGLDSGENAPEEKQVEASPEVAAESQTDSVDEQVTKSETEEHSESDTEVKKESWQQKYRTLQGMYNKEVPSLNAQNRELNSRVSQLESLLGTMNKQEKPAEPVVADKLITDSDIEEYGDSIEIMRKAAKEELSGQMGRVAQLEQEIAKLRGVVPQVQQVQQQQVQ